jgi:hypothetical protein
MEKMPMSPVSVVVFSILSNGPGDGSNVVFSLTLLSGRRIDLEGLLAALFGACAVYDL